MSDDFQIDGAAREAGHMVDELERHATRIALVGAHLLPDILHMVRRLYFESPDDDYRAAEAYEVSESSAPRLTEKDRLQAVCLHVTGNEEELKDVPKYQIGDVAIVPRYRIDDEVGYIPTRATAADYEMTPAEILETAVHNVRPEDYKVATLPNALKALGVDVPNESDTDMLVCTNEAGYLGAAGVFVSKAVRKKIYDAMGGDYYVLPSSIHEVLAVPADTDISPWELEQLVQTINAELVAPEDRLSETIFKVGKTLTIKPAVTRTESPVEAFRQSLHM